MMVSEHNHVKVLAVHFTKACSHQCSFCYASASSSKKHVAPNHATLIKVIEAAAASNVEELVFLGGDPCTYSKLLQLCEAAHSNNMTTTVLSNTHVYQTDDVRTVTQLVDCFETTLHGPSPNEHDTIALSEGAFDKVLTNLGRLATSARSMGIAYNITPHNCRHLVDTVEHAIDRRGLPIDHLLVQRIIPQGRGRTTSKFSIGCTHAVAALEQIERLSTRYHSLRVSFEDAFPFCVIPQRFHKYLNRCEWGFSRASVDNRGNLSRCGADPRYRLGNILRTPLDQIWNTSDILAQFRSRKYLPQDCQNCALLTSCGGGCALSCEIEKDHGPDYLYFERANDTMSFHAPYDIRQANYDDLSDILRIEWSCFPEYEFRFTPKSIVKWYAYNPGMFRVLEDAGRRVVGYACLVPLSDSGFNKLRAGSVSSLLELSQRDVIQKPYAVTSHWHIEAIATLADARSRAGRTLVRCVGEFLLHQATIVTASPVTYIGRKLCCYFDFRKIATDRKGDHDYDIYKSHIESQLLSRLKRF